jgi:hypothetical protein
MNRLCNTVQKQHVCRSSLNWISIVSHAYGFMDSQSPLPIKPHGSVEPSFHNRFHGPREP